MPCGGFRELEDYHSLYKDSRINPDDAHFLLFGLKKRCSEIVFLNKCL